MNKLEGMTENIEDKRNEIGTFEAKKNLSRLLVNVQQGMIYTITKRGAPVAQLVPYREGRRSPMDEVLGRFKAIRSSVTASDNVKSYLRRGRH